MDYEVEQKFRVADWKATQEALSKMGSAFGESISQTDKYFSHPARDFSQTDEVFRLRSDGEANYLTYKGPRIDSHTKTRMEFEIPLPSGSESREQFDQLLNLLGFRVLVYVRKKRTKTLVQWQGSSVEVVLDEVEALGTFVELETLADESAVAAARERIATFADYLKLTENERRSYSELMLQAEKA